MALALRVRLESSFVISSAVIPSLTTWPALEVARFDMFYIHVVRTAALGATSQALVQKSCERLREVLGAMIAMEGHPTVDMLVDLLGLAQDQVARIVLVKTLLLAVESAWQPLVVNTRFRVCHPSICTFLLDPQHCHYGRPWRAHDVPAQRCLQLLNRSLRKNICDIQNFTLPNSAIVNLQTQLRRCISSALRYASEHALTHLVLSGAPDEHLCLELFTFCREHLLHWIELLSLHNRLAFCLQQLESAVGWCQVRVFPCFQYPNAKRSAH
jgi:hypothetical protein